MKNNSNKCKDFFLKEGIMTISDYKIMGILTLIFTILVFIRLGNTYAPKSYYETNSENRDIIIDFGDYINIEKMHVYLGNLDNRKVSLSAYNEVTKTWEIINSDMNISSVFQWNTLNIYYNLRYLGIVTTSDSAVYNEFVFTGPDGIITPVNTSKYEELFDEQDMFYKTDNKSYMDGTMFDEIYHARTGYEFVHGLPTYETTHPQLGKCLLAFSIILFGMNPFGWRFIVAIFGIFFIPLFYIFAKRLFKDTFIASCAGIFITFDCMHFTLSRIATIDIFVAFFIVFSYYYMYKYLSADNAYRNLAESCLTDKFPPKSVSIPLALSGVFMGLAISTKLTGVYAGLGLAVILIAHLIKYPPRQQTIRLFFFCFFFFIIFPIIVYILAYIPAVEAYAQMGYTDKSITWNENGLYIGYGWTGLLARTLRNTNYMINYHTNLVATHYYESPFYEWPIMWMPLLASNNTVNEALNLTSSVSYIGNILIWWAAIPSVLFCIIRSIFKKDKKALFLTISYFAQYIPWMSVGRITFIYHYLPSLLFSMLTLTYSIQILINWKPALKKYVKIFLGLVILIFFIFYPIISGMPIRKDWGLHLRWLPDWILVL